MSLSLKNKHTKATSVSVQAIGESRISPFLEELMENPMTLLSISKSLLPFCAEYEAKTTAVMKLCVHLNFI